jgi:hypothetical protein
MNYYGVRYAKNCHPAELFVTYFTSSKYVADYIKKHGLPDIIEVRKTFTEKDRVKKALLHEHRTLKKLKVIHRSDYLNKTDNYAIAPESRGRCPLDMTIYTFIHKSGIIENATRHDMIEKYKLIKSKLSELINGNRHRHGGWRMTWSLSDDEMNENKKDHYKKLVEIKLLPAESVNVAIVDTNFAVQERIFMQSKIAQDRFYKAQEEFGKKYNLEFLLFLNRDY